MKQLLWHDNYNPDNTVKINDGLPYRMRAAD